MDNADELPKSAAKDWLTNAVKFVHKPNVMVFATVVGFVSGIITIAEVFQPSDLTPGLKKVIHPEEVDTRQHLQEMHDDFSRRLDELNRYLKQEQILGTRPTTSPDSSQRDTLARPTPLPAAREQNSKFTTAPASSTCDSELTSKATIPFFVSATVNGTSEISPENIRNFIGNQFFPKTPSVMEHPGCDTIRLRVTITLTNQDMSGAEKADLFRASAQIEYAAVRTDARVTIGTDYSERFTENKYDSNPRYPPVCVIEHAIRKNLSDPVLADFLKTNFRIKSTELAAAGSLASQCEVDSLAYLPP